MQRAAPAYACDVREPCVVAAKTTPPPPSTPSNQHANSGPDGSRWSGRLRMQSHRPPRVRALRRTSRVQAWSIRHGTCTYCTWKEWHFSLWHATMPLRGSWISGACSLDCSDRRRGCQSPPATSGSPVEPLSGSGRSRLATTALCSSWGAM